MEVDGPVRPDPEENGALLKQELGQSVDLIYRSFTCEFLGARKGLLVYIDGLAEGVGVRDLLQSAVRLANPPHEHPRAKSDPVLDFAETVVLTIEHRTSQKLKDALEAVLAGEAALFLEGAHHVLIGDTRYNPGRGVEEPATETEVRGPRDGMVENIRLNTTLIRRRLRDPKLRIEPLVVGRRTRTDVAVAFIQDVADKAMVAEVKRRIQKIDIDAVHGSATIEHAILDSPWSPFSALMVTERPDRVCASILEGQVAILTDNTPFVMLAPSILWQFLQAPGDYYHNFYTGTLARWIRFGALLFALVLPSLYTILTTFHHEMIPSPLALSIAGGREGTPFPTVGEVLLMEIMFEVIQEAGLRLPRAVGQTVSIVGALVIGEAAVQAGLVAPATVIVIATAGITGFAIPSYTASLAVRLSRLPLLLISGTLGVFGFIMATSVLMLHLTSLRSFGAPFLSPVAPLQTPELKDSILRLPGSLRNRRPRFSREDRTRRQRRMKPDQPTGNTGGGP